MSRLLGKKKLYTLILIMSIISSIISITVMGYFIRFGIGTWAFRIRSNEEGGWPSCAISADGRYMVMGRFNYVYFFEKSIPIPVWSYRLDMDVGDVDITADGQYIIVGGLYGDFYLFKKSNPIPLWIDSTDQLIYDTDISSDGKYCIIRSNLGFTLYSFQGDNPVPLWTSVLGDDKVKISADGEKITAIATNNTLSFFDKSNPTPIWQRTFEIFLNDVAMTPNGKYIATGGYVQSLSGYELYLFNSSSSIPKIMYTETPISAIQFSQDGEYIAVSCWDGIYLFNTSSLSRIWRYSPPYEAICGNFAISGNGEFIAAELWRDPLDGLINQMLFFSTRNNSTQWTVKLEKENQVYEVGISFNGNDIAVATDYIFYHINRNNPMIGGFYQGILDVSLIFVMISTVIVFVMGLSHYVNYQQIKLAKKNKY